MCQFHKLSIDGEKQVLGFRADYCMDENIDLADNKSKISNSSCGLYREFTSESE